jgi:hypothetical protein
MKKAGLNQHQPKSPVQFLIIHAEIYFLHQISSPHGCHPAIPTFAKELVDA